MESSFQSLIPVLALVGGGALLLLILLVSFKALVKTAKSCLVLGFLGVVILFAAAAALVVFGGLR